MSESTTCWNYASPDDEHDAAAAAAAREEELLRSLVWSVRLLQLAGRRRTLARDADVEVSTAVLELIETIAVAGTGHATGLADLLGLPASRVRLLAGRAVDEGLLDREWYEWDGRCVIYTLTPAGREVVDAVRSARTELLARLTFAWPQKDREELGRLLQKLAIGQLDVLRGRLW